MSLSVTLPYGVVAIYGTGYPTGITGLTAPNGYTFGEIFQVGPHDIQQAAVGQSVLYKNTDKVTVVLATVQYQILPESKIILTELPLL